MNIFYISYYLTNSLSHYLVCRQSSGAPIHGEDSTVVYR